MRKTCNLQMEEMRPGATTPQILRVGCLEEWQIVKYPGSRTNTEVFIMQYSEGTMGRVFVLRIDHGEDMIGSLKKFVQEKKIESCFALFIGALRDGQAVAGPEMPVIPPIPHFESFEGAWEVFGLGMIFPSQEGPKLHIHTAFGRGREALMGCVRDKATVYLIVEVVLLEFSSLNAFRELDHKTGIHLLMLEKNL